MGETLKEEDLNQMDYNMAQLHLARYMIRKEIIKTLGEYVENGHAAAFELVATGAITVPDSVDWDKIRQEVKTLTKQL